MIYYSITSCSLGYLLVAFSHKGVCSISLGQSEAEIKQNDKRLFETNNTECIEGSSNPPLQEIIKIIDNPKAEIDITLDIKGTLFQKRVWQTLQMIPIGETRSYSEIAIMIGNKNATRAVARACAQNTIAIIIPCHRVIRKDGTIGEYRWGIKIKERILKNEADY